MLAGIAYAAQSVLFALRRVRQLGVVTEHTASARATVVRAAGMGEWRSGCEVIEFTSLLPRIMVGRDPLLGPARHGGKAESRGSFYVALAFLIGVVALAAFLLGNWWHSAGRGQLPPVATVVPRNKAVLAAGKPGTTFSSAAAPTSRPVPPFRLKPVTNEDSDRVGVGCRCSFSLPGQTAELLIAGGEDLAVFRPDGSRKLCPLKEEQLQAMFDGDVRIDCGTSRVLVKEHGLKTPGLDGHSSAAKVTVIYSGAERQFEGTWGCFC